MTTRRAFAFIPARGRRSRSRTRSSRDRGITGRRSGRERSTRRGERLESLLAKYVGGKRVAMEYSAGDAVPYLDRVPAGVIEMVRASGATVVSSGELVSRFYATWSADNIASHERAAEVIAAIARKAMRIRRRARADRGAARRARADGVDSGRVSPRRSLDRPRPERVGRRERGEPALRTVGGSPRVIRAGEILLIDLWAREDRRRLRRPDLDGVARQAVRRRRSRSGMPCATRATRRSLLVRERAQGQRPTRGADVDDAARRVIESRGFGEYFTHRTGHSIDPRDLHGSGPHLDNLETREERLLVPGVGVLDRAGDLHPREDRHAKRGQRVHRAGRGRRDAARLPAGSAHRLSGWARRS